MYANCFNTSGVHWCGMAPLRAIRNINPREVAPNARAAAVLAPLKMLCRAQLQYAYARLRFLSEKIPRRRAQLPHAYARLHFFNEINPDSGGIIF